MPRLRHSLLLLPLLAGAAIALLAGLGGAPAEAREHRAGGDDVTFRNRGDASINCSLPTFQGGKPFRVEAGDEYDVNVSDLTGVEPVDKATCAGQTVSVAESSLESGHLTLEYTGSRFTALGYFYIHAHLVSPARPDCQSTSPPKGQDFWAETAAGFCKGAFLGGSEPYDRTEGITFWSPGPGGAIQVKMAALKNGRLGLGFECVTKNRGSDACYTDSATGAAVGQPGGPLKLDVQNDRNGLRYVFLRGFCANSDRGCLPH
jgi:hypothetical protein